MYFGIDLIRKKKKAVHLLESSSTETEIGFPALLNGALLEQEEGAVSPAVDSLNVNISVRALCLNPLQTQ